MNNDILITLPSNDIGFVEYKRSFCVEGKFNIAVPNDAKLRINILDSLGRIVRFIETDCKNKPIVLDYPGLITYADELDPDRKLMQKFGYPILCVNDINMPELSIHNATIKLWYNDFCFKGIIISTSNIENGAIFDDGLNFVDENGKSYSCLDMGDYKIEVVLSKDNEVLAKAYKEFVIGKRDKQLICRFNPISHKERMIKWCVDNNIAIIKDLLPGYLESYLGTWYYHMGILKAYRANDICLFDDTYVVMFDYLIDPTSTSYETELAYLQTQNKINKDRFESWHYDIGEASVKGVVGTPIRFNDDEYMSICRIDVVNNLAKENIYYLDDRAINKTLLKDYIVYVNESIQIMGVVKPWQMDSKDFILKDDNTYTINNYPDIIHYEFICDGHVYTEDRKLLMDRIDKESIGTSVYEFYNLFTIRNEWKGKLIKVNITCIDKKGNITLAKDSIEIKVN